MAIPDPTSKEYGLFMWAFLNKLKEKNPSILVNVRGLSRYVGVSHTTFYKSLSLEDKEKIERFMELIDDNDVKLIADMIESIVRKTYLQTQPR